MKRLGVGGQRWLKAFHIVFSGVWTGVTLGALILNLNVGSAANSAELGAYLSSAQLVADLIPIASVGTIVTGLLLSGLTAWGFFKYWSVIFQLVATVLVILIAQIWLDPAGATLRAMAETEGIAALTIPDFSQASQLVLGSAGANLGVLIATCLVAAVKPWGRTRRISA